MWEVIKGKEEISALIKIIKEAEELHDGDIWSINKRYLVENGESKVRLLVSLDGKGLAKTFTVRKIKKFKEEPLFEIEKSIYQMKKQIDKYFDPYKVPIHEDIEGVELYDIIYDTILMLRFNCETYDIYIGTNMEEEKITFYMQSRENPNNKWQRDVKFKTFEAIAEARGTDYIPVFVTDIIMDGYLKKEDTGFRAVMDKKVPQKKEEWDDGSENIADIQKKVSSIRTDIDES